MKAYHVIAFLSLLLILYSCFPINGLPISDQNIEKDTALKGV
jgi:hypothetical protein